MLGRVREVWQSLVTLVCRSWWRRNILGSKLEFLEVFLKGVRSMLWTRLGSCQVLSPMSTRRSVWRLSHIDIYVNSKIEWEWQGSGSSITIVSLREMSSEVNKSSDPYRKNELLKRNRLDQYKRRHTSSTCIWIKAFANELCPVRKHTSPPRITCPRLFAIDHACPVPRSRWQS